MGVRLIYNVYIVHRPVDHLLEVVPLRPQHQVLTGFRFPFGADPLIHREVGVTILPGNLQPLADQQLLELVPTPASGL